MGKKSKSSAEDDASGKEASTPALPSLPDNDSWLNIEFKMIGGWTHFDFHKLLRDQTYIFTIRDLLVERHGLTKDLKMCIHSFTDANELKNDMLVLKDYGVQGKRLELNSEGGVDTKSIPSYTIMYEFKPKEFEDPILLYFN